MNLPQIQKIMMEFEKQNDMMGAPVPRSNLWPAGNPRRILRQALAPFIRTASPLVGANKQTEAPIMMLCTFSYGDLTFYFRCVASFFVLGNGTIQSGIL